MDWGRRIVSLVVRRSVARVVPFDGGSTLS